MTQLDITKFFISLFKQHGEMPKVWEKALADQGLRFNGEDLVEIEPQSNAVDILLDGIDPDKMVDEFILPDSFTKRFWSGEFRTALLEIYRQGLEDMLQAIRDNNTKKG